MDIEQNSPELWDKVWQRPVSAGEDEYRLRYEEHTIRWQRIEQRVLDHFGTFKNLNVIEIGAGRGTNAALFAKRGANVSVLDYSDRALQRSQEFFQRTGVQSRSIRANALDPPQGLRETFDVSLSFGLTEHFLDDARIQINRTHLDLVRPGGMAFIAVPHCNNPPYRLFKYIAERTGRWGVGEEYPYSRREFREICRQIGVADYEFFGESVFESLHFLNPLNKRLFRGLLGLGPINYQKKGFRRQRGTPLDTMLSYSLVLCARKPSGDCQKRRQAS